MGSFLTMRSTAVVDTGVIVRGREVLCTPRYRLVKPTSTSIIVPSGSSVVTHPISASVQSAFNALEDLLINRQEGKLNFRQLISTWYTSGFVRLYSIWTTCLKSSHSTQHFGWLWISFCCQTLFLYDCFSFTKADAQSTNYTVLR